MANEYIIRTDMKVSGSALTVDGLTTLENLTVFGPPSLAGGGTGPAPGAPTFPDSPISNGSNDFIYLSEPHEWIPITIGGTNYVIPAYAI